MSTASSLAGCLLGINILAHVILIGRHVGGWIGSVSAVAGLMVPATALTVALCVAYQAVQHVPQAAGPLLGLSAAVAGFTIALILDLAKGVVKRRTVKRDLLLLASFLAAAVSGLHPVAVLVVSAAVGAIFPPLLGTDRPPEAGDDGA